MLEALRQAVLAANLALPESGLVRFTWGNVSGIDRARGLVVIKPSGVDYAALRAEDLAVVALDSGRHVSGLRPSSDTPTHLALYRAFDHIGGVVHTHSRWATIFAQAGRGIPPLGTTHADDFLGEIPCAPPLTDDEIAGAYEANTGAALILAVGDRARTMPAALACGHGPFAWGESPEKAVYHAVVLEEAAMMAWHTLALCPGRPDISAALQTRHYTRKHGQTAYYGQSGRD